MSRRQSFFRTFFMHEASGAILLMVASAGAMLCANLPGDAGAGYNRLIHAVTGPPLNPALGPMTVHLWINDGLMALFFLLVGLEIKREWLAGALSNWSQRRLPMIAALAGMICPALLYLAVAGGDPALVSGWAIPAATDIAFAIGVLSLLGDRVPGSLKLLLTAIAIVDDMGAVAIIALAYTQDLAIVWLLAAVAILAAMMVFNRLGVRVLAPYLLGFALLWYAMLMSGIHATVAGVLAATAIPIGKGDGVDSPLRRLEHALHPWTAYCIIPLFGFANAGLHIDAAMLASLLSPLPIGIALGLFVGKQIGIFGGIWAAARISLVQCPAEASWAQVHGMAVLCGIGFTMSIFIGGLAFADSPMLVEQAKGGVLLGTLISALTGYVLLRRSAS